MLTADAVIVIALGYVGFLFLLAWFSDRMTRRGNRWITNSPLIYTLSISVYCTSWTFYGAVGSAARGGLEFVTIYLGPTLIFIGWWYLLRKLVRIGHVHRISSIADLISSRFGKSNTLAVLVTLIAVVGTTPYIALQLKAVTSSFAVLSSANDPDFVELTAAAGDFEGALWVAMGMALFTILFGTRNLEANEQHPGVVAAIAFEALVKLLALVLVGVFVIFAAGGMGELFDNDRARALLQREDMFGGRWAALTFLAAAAILCLPRQFQVTVVENSHEAHLQTAGWLFPLYLLLICLFVLPIALAGLTMLPEGADPDMFVLTLPMAADQDMLALFAFIGGFSSATSMVIVACIALSIMISNHIVMPVVLRMPWLGFNRSGDLKTLVLNSRRFSIVLVLGLGLLYYRFSAQNEALASMGLIAFAGVAQFLPPMLAGLYWRRATAAGAKLGLVGGVLLWTYTLLLPSLAAEGNIVAGIVRDGLGGYAFLRPQALFGLTDMDPLVHSVVWSLTANVVLLVAGSLFSEPRPLERLQSALFVNVFRNPAGNESRALVRTAAIDDLRILTRRILGAERADRLFREFAVRQGHGDETPTPDASFIAHLEREIGGSVGAASARVMISEVVSGETISFDEIIRMVDETQQVIEYSQALEANSRALERTAGELRRANERLMRLDNEKDDFLSQVSHELRTPMTSIRSFAEVLMNAGDLPPEQARRFVRIIHDESIRLTGLLNEILDLSHLERGEVNWKMELLDPEAAVERAISACEGLAADSGVRIEHEDAGLLARVNGDRDRIAQVLINLISNAIKYNDNPEPWVRIACETADGDYRVHVEDNGPGVDDVEADHLFSKFARGWRQIERGRSGTGLGLAISAQIARRLGGRLELTRSDGTGSCFSLVLPLARVEAAE
ncbi:sensor histidine kinase [Minwuia thermotolerans]|uniref:histidine kinase n=1 Tax=Minwuia thermotolerans TaxID=2056226 RepID=A0A2M9FYL1_9PROT|nr:sensor histidine kinase [Minwuia thermotolerans]PJK28544.1 sodium:solute symporter [Minwuia thermotolerans]